MSVSKTEFYYLASAFGAVLASVRSTLASVQQGAMGVVLIINLQSILFSGWVITQYKMFVYAAIIVGIVALVTSAVMWRRLQKRKSQLSHSIDEWNRDLEDMSIGLKQGLSDSTADDERLRQQIKIVQNFLEDLREIHTNR
jgi:ABC-type nickel/cobalt efflux system permease component RcnA